MASTTLHASAKPRITAAYWLVPRIHSGCCRNLSSRTAACATAPASGNSARRCRARSRNVNVSACFRYRLVLSQYAPGNSSHARVRIGLTATGELGLLVGAQEHAVALLLPQLLLALRPLFLAVVQPLLQVQALLLGDGTLDGGQRLVGLAVEGLTLDAAQTRLFGNASEMILTRQERESCNCPTPFSLDSENRAGPWSPGAERFDNRG